MLIPEVSSFSVVMHDEYRYTYMTCYTAENMEFPKNDSSSHGQCTKTRHIVSSVPTIQQQKEGQDVSLKRFFLLRDVTRSLYVCIKSLLRALC